MDTALRSKWLRWVLAVGFAAGAALLCSGWIGNGITAGALIGLPGRESDVAIAQRYGSYFFTAALLLQIGVAVVLYFLLDFAVEAARPTTFAVRSLVAGMLSVPFTFLVAAVVAGALQLLKPILGY